MEAYEYLEKIRAAAPRVHCITNYVTAHDVANMILACGANPVMADEPQEMGEITAHAGALALNMGTPGERRGQAMLAAGKAANANGIPVLLDPVGVGASTFRRKMAEELLEAVTFTAIRGNMSEIRTLSELAEKKVTGSSGGVDVCPVDVVTEETLAEAVTFVKAVSKRLGAVVAVTGAIDLVSDGQQCAVIRGGREEMSRVTGTGCQLSGLAAAFLAVACGMKTPAGSTGGNTAGRAAYAARDVKAPAGSSGGNTAGRTACAARDMEAVAAAVCVMNAAGEIAWEQRGLCGGNASYGTGIIDAVYRMDQKMLEGRIHYEVR
ncbi:MAG: hydroxyethylthiazole kinase [Roseburia hominis]|nr:hydroxyethylthiazole kinase [Roseburia hominis]